MISVFTVRLPHLRKLFVCPESCLKVGYNLFFGERLYLGNPSLDETVARGRNCQFLMARHKIKLDRTALPHFNKIPSLRKNHHKTVTTTIRKTEYRQSNDRYFHYAENMTNSAAKLGT